MKSTKKHAFIMLTVLICLAVSAVLYGCVETEHTISFDANGGEVSLENISTSGKEKLTLPTPAREDHRFDGWFTDKELTVPFTEDSLLNISLDKDVTLYAKWTRVVFTISFVPDNGATYDAVKTSGDEVISLPTPFKEGYRFDGWFVDETFDTEFNGDEYAATTLTQDITLYAKWTAYHSISFDLGYQTTVTFDPIVTTGNEVITLPAPTCDEFRFDGWFTDNAFTTEFTDDSLLNTALENDITLYAKWTRVVFTISFAPDNGATYDAVKTSGNEVVTLPVPVKEGFRFDGWFVDETFDTEFNGDEYAATALTQDITLYAKWTAYHNITFDLGYQSSLTLENIVTTGNETITLPAPTRDEFRFDGWFTDANYSTKFTDDSLLNTALESDITLYAKWTRVVFAISFVPDNSTTYDAIKTSGNEVISLPTPVKDGFRFDGWFTDNAFTTEFNGNEYAATVLTQDIILYAKWTAYHSISFDLGYQTIFTLDPIVTTGNEVITLPAPTRDEFRFDGWFTDANYSTKFTDDSLLNTALESDITLYAKWTRVVFAISFVPDNGTTYDDIKTSGNEVVTLPVPVKEGFRFDGWFVDETFDTEFKGDEYVSATLTQDVALYAKWTKIHTVTWYKDAYTVLSADTVPDNEYVERHAEVYRDDYVFNGWYRNADGSSAVDFKERVTADTDIYAGWIPADTIYDFDYLSQELAQSMGLGHWDGYVVSDKANTVYGEEMYFPMAYNGKPVIFVSGFQEHNEIVKVTIPQSVYYLDGSLFANCASLTEFVNSDSLEYIGGGILAGTPWFTAQPAGIVYAGSAAIEYKGSAVQGYFADFREGTRVIAERLFWTWTWVTGVRLPASLVNIGFNAFLKCSLETIEVSADNEYYKAVDNVLYSKDGKTLNLYGIAKPDESFTVPETVTAIADEAFAFALNLKNLVITDNVKTIGDGVFDGSKLESITFGRGIERVGDGVLHMNSQLTEIIILSPTPFPYGVYFVQNSGNSARKIKVPAEYVDAYKNDSLWREVASYIVPLETV